MSKVMGIDPSLTSTGIAFRETGGKIRNYALGQKPLRGMQRLSFMKVALRRHLERVAPSLVVYEGYALGYRGKSNALFSLGELGGVFKLLILEMGIDILIVPPSVMKRFVTGKGNSDKEEVALTLRKQLNIQFSSNDQSDATGLLLLGEAYIQEDKENLPVHQIATLKECEYMPGFLKLMSKK